MRSDHLNKHLKIHTNGSQKAVKTPGNVKLEN